MDATRFIKNFLDKWCLDVQGGIQFFQDHLISLQRTNTKTLEFEEKENAIRFSDLDVTSTIHSYFRYI